jgi:hypothetical protein
MKEASAHNIIITDFNDQSEAQLRSNVEEHRTSKKKTEKRKKQPVGMVN